MRITNKISYSDSVEYTKFQNIFASGLKKLLSCNSDMLTEFATYLNDKYYDEVIEDHFTYKAISNSIENIITLYSLGYISFDDETIVVELVTDGKVEVGVSVYYLSDYNLDDSTSWKKKLKSKKASPFTKTNGVSSEFFALNNMFEVVSNLFFRDSD